MVVYIFTAEHAENKESRDNHLGSSYNPGSPLDNSLARVPVCKPFFLRHLSALRDLGGKR